MVALSKEVLIVHDFLKNTIIAEDMEMIYQSRVHWDEFNEKVVYVTGSTGMLASYLIMFLIYLKKEHYINVNIVAGIRNRDKAKGLFGEYIDAGIVRLYDVDILEPIQHDTRIDYIIHAASLASPQYYGKLPVETILPNVVATYNILEYARQNRISGMLFFSTGDVYGTVLKGDGIKENDIGFLNYLDTGSFYAESKRCGEAMCRAYWLEYGVPAKFVRISHTYGPNMNWQHDTRVFAEFVKNIINGEDIVMKSDGSAKRPFCYITDNITGIFKILLEGNCGEAYNVGNENTYISIKNLANKLACLFPEKNIKVVTEARNMQGYAANKEQRSSTMVTCKTRELGWKPHIGIEDGFRRTILSIEQKLKSN